MALLNPTSFITASPLDSFSIRYSNDQDKYAALKLFPPVITPKKTGEFYILSKDNLRSIDATAPAGTEAPSHTYSARKETFTCVTHRVKTLVLGADARDFDRAVADLDQEAAMQNMDSLLIEMEVAAHTKATTSTNYPSGLVTTLVDNSTRWSDSLGDPMSVVKTSSQAIFESCGKRPNKLFLSKTGFETLKNNAAIVDRVKYTGNAATLQILCALLELEEIVVSDVLKNTANEGAADVGASVWDDDAVLAVVDPTPRLRSMSYGKTFMSNNLYVSNIDQPLLGAGLGAHYVETGWEWTQKTCATIASNDGDFAAGALIINIF